MSEDDFKKINKSIGGLIGFNCFLSTSHDRNVALKFAKANPTNGCICILFTITIDSSLSSVSFASVSENSCSPDENELLFTMNTIFKVKQVQSLSDENGVHMVSLELTNDDDPIFTGLKKDMIGRAGGCSEHQLAWILNDMGEHDLAETVYLDLLKATVKEREKGPWYHQLGFIKNSQGKYLEAISFYDKAMKIYKTELPENRLELAKIYHQMGLAYDNLKAYEQALRYYEAALTIKREKLPENHRDLATSYNNIGLVYDNMGNSEKALINYEKALAILKRTLPKDHPDLAHPTLNIGTVYYSMKKFSEALEYIEEARRIRATVLPSTHVDIKKAEEWLSIVKRSMR